MRNLDRVFLVHEIDFLINNDSERWFSRNFKFFVFPRFFIPNVLGNFNVPYKIFFLEIEVLTQNYGLALARFESEECPPSGLEKWLPSVDRNFILGLEVILVESVWLEEPVQPRLEIIQIEVAETDQRRLVNGDEVFQVERQKLGVLREQTIHLDLGDKADREVDADLLFRFYVLDFRKVDLLVVQEKGPEEIRDLLEELGPVMSLRDEVTEVVLVGGGTEREAELVRREVGGECVEVEEPEVLDPANV